VFLINRGEVGKRLDAYYHKLEFRQLRETYTNKKFSFVGALINSWDRGDGPRDGFYTEDSENGVYFLRINNLKNNSIDLTGVKFINRVVHEKTLKRSKVTAGDLIFAISGTKDNLGTVSIVPDFILEANLNSALVRLNLDFSKIDKKYFCLLFSLAFVRTQIDYIGKGAAQNNLNNEEISQIQIPLPSLEKQNTIVSIFENAKDVKRQKETEAAQLLASIDGYLLAALGITLPLPSEKKTFFITSSSKISGGRFDPFYHQDYFAQLNYSLESGEYKTAFLRDIAHFQSGYAFDSKQYVDDSNCLLVTIKNIKSNTIDLSTVTFLPDEFFEKYSNFQIQRGDLLIAMTGATIGKVGIYESDKKSLMNQRNGIIRPSIFSNELYLMNLLNLKCFQNLIVRNSNGGAQPNISETDIMKIKIPLPPLEKQTEIADHISALRSQAKQLQQEAQTELEQAKIKVERLILGDIQ
jgi:restriction endonuclease S subunit